MLFVVLVVVAMLTLGAYTFSELMTAELEATSMHGRQAQARLLAESGVETVATLLNRRGGVRSDALFDNPALFREVLVGHAASSRGSGRFSIVAPLESDQPITAIRFGLSDESAKLNLNALPLGRQQRTQARATLLAIDRMTPQIADAILDWLDADEEPRPYGAESSYYTTLTPPYRAKNGRLQSLEELLAVRGVTPELLFGEDVNHNGWLDPNENDGNASYPPDNADGCLQRGWIAMLTVCSRESNLQPDGRPKVNVNQPSLARLYDQVADQFGPNTAQFVAAYRIVGPLQDQELAAQQAKRELDAEEMANEAEDRAKRQRGETPSTAPAEVSAEDLERGGIQLSAKPVYRVRSVLDLVGVAVRIEVNGADTVLDSPWSGDPGSLRATLPRLLERLTTCDGPTIEGRINVNRAPLQVLRGIPEITPELTAAIVAARRETTRQTNDRTTIAWLFYEGLTDLVHLRRLAPYLTTGGDVYRMHAVGHFDAGGPVVHLEAVVDASRVPPRIISFQELPPIGVEYVPLLRGSFPR